MTERTRDYLRQEFQNGERPSGADFADMLDSSLSKLDDGLSIGADGTLVLARGIRLGDSADAQPGTLRFNGGVPQYHDGVGFVEIGGGGGAFQPVGAGPDVSYSGAGTVGIGQGFAATAATYRLEVELDVNAGAATQVRFGEAAIHRGAGAQAGAAHFSHRANADNTNFALRQRQTGEVNLNTPVNVPMFFTQGGNAASARMTISPNGRVLVGTVAELTNDAQTLLHLGGNAIKNVGGASWSTPSDARLKENVTDYAVGLEAIRAVRPVVFHYNGKAGTLRGSPGIGVIGQEIEKVMPETISTVAARLDDAAGEVDDLRIYDSGALVYALVNAVKELSARVEVLEAALGRN